MTQKIFVFYWNLQKLLHNTLSAETKITYPYHIFNDTCRCYSVFFDNLRQVKKTSSFHTHNKPAINKHHRQVEGLSTLYGVLLKKNTSTLSKNTFKCDITSVRTIQGKADRTDSVLISLCSTVVQYRSSTAHAESAERPVCQ